MNNEKALLESIDKDEWFPAKKKEQLIDELKITARNTVLKDQRMNVRISKKDLTHLKAKALEEGIPYQTLVTSIIHKYISGNLKDVSRGAKN